MPVHKDHEVKKYSENHILKNIYLQPKNIQSCMLDSKILKIVKNINQRLKDHDFYLLLYYLYYQSYHIFPSVCSSVFLIKI